MIKIKVGSKFERKTRQGTTHNLIVLHDSIKNKRVLYNVDLNVCQGTPILLYCHYVGDATKEELTKHQTAFNNHQ
jgi:hypothetical protein